ncbi:predicted protein [Lichtheimia corymbifera JMRC:FSU:9682]|uniref:Uncharacterized protein n=1 Tax=Lichtheimia corymbifera JMRC:FSU:9682 TaxID=1263082 RepID=A0A068RXT3_9FUNG|nr:predicted protein [Lichtheimia corymbifera JMRC:FSU:9682]
MSEAVIKSISTLSHHRITYQPEDEGWIQKNEDVDVFLDVAATFAHDGAIGSCQLDKDEDDGLDRIGLVPKAECAMYAMPVTSCYNEPIVE